VVRALPGTDPLGDPVADAAGRAAYRAAVRGRLDAVARSVRPDGAVTAVLREGPGDLVLRHESRSAALLVVGATGDAAVPGPGLGPVAAALARWSACPVLLVWTAPLAGTVVVGVDGGPGTAALLATAAAEAVLRGTSLLVVHAWDRAHDRSPAVESAIDAAERDLLESYVRPLSEGSPALRVDLRVVHARPDEVLLTASAAAVLVVLGRHAGRRSGRTTDVVAAGAVAPVLVVPLGGAPPASIRRSAVALAG
jgi:nucleotide-binding universal stress UspA family protein